jgi:hypothetical protein
MSTAAEILGIFALMFIGITVATLWFAHSTSKMKNKKEIQKRKIDVIDKHFKEMLRVECPYCQTIYKSTESECPNCRANPVKLLIPEMPE